MRDLHDYQQKYKEQPYERFQVGFRKRKIKELLQTYKHDTLLEIGCGLDPAFNAIDTFRQLYIVEPGQLFYDNALQQLQGHARVKDVSILHQTIETATGTLSSVHFNFILLSALLNEVPDAGAMLQVVNRLAAPDTVVHINVPNARSFHRLLAVQMGLIPNEFQHSESNIHFQQSHVFDIDTLTALVEKNGFTVLDSGSYSFKPFTHLQMENMLQQGLLTEAMLEGLYRMEKYVPGLGSEIYVNAIKK